MKVGGCYPGEDLIDCTAGGNEYKTGGSCKPGHKEGISITCSGQGDRYSSCLDEGNIVYIHQKKLQIQVYTFTAVQIRFITLIC